MEIQEKIRIVMIGAGSVATHLSMAIRNAGHLIIQVYSRTNKSAKQLAEVMNCDFTTSLSTVKQDADLYILALSDEAIVNFATDFSFPQARVIHLSGGLEMDLFDGKVKNYGLMYPVQTFSKARDVDFKSIPLCIEASNPEMERFLMHLAGQLSSSIHILNSNQRQMIHLAAVYSCNFVNHLYDIASRILGNNDLPFDLLSPLIIETTNKVRENLPRNVQTGPATRNDQLIINKHLELLSSNSRYQSLYTELSKSIRQEMEEDKNS